MLLLCLLLAAPDDKLARAKQAYDEYEFERAAQLYKEALATPDKYPAARLEEGYLYQAFSAFIAKRPEAKEALRKLFHLNPAHTLDRRGLHPDLVAFYDRERPVRVAPVVPQKAPVKPVAVVTPVREPYRPAPWPARVLPFGIGQFANGDPVAGSLWLVGGLALAAVHVSGVVLQQRSHVPGTPNDFSDPNATTYWYMRTVGGVALIATGILSIVDAIVWSPGRGEARYNARVSMAPLVLDRGIGIAAGAHF